MIARAAPHPRERAKRAEVQQEDQSHHADPADEKFERFVASIDPDGNKIDPEELISTYDELSRLGFRFSDLVKYSDHHSQEFPASEVLSKVNFNDQVAFESKVAAAYVRFYARRGFIDTYSELVANGY